MPEQAIKISCPHCGKVRTINPGVFGISKGPPSPALEKAYQKKETPWFHQGANLPAGSTSNAPTVVNLTNTIPKRTKPA